MKITHVLGTTLAVGVVGAAASAAPLSLSVPPFAFLRYHVDSTQQLARQVSIDTTVQNRFARHFHMAGPAVASFIENNLVLKPLSAAHTFHVYCVTSKGHEYSFVENLPAGTPVFVRKQDGLPVINQVDGNPLVDNLPPVLHDHNNGPVALARFSQPSIDLAKLRTVDVGNGSPTALDQIDYFDYNGQQVGAKETSAGIVFVDQSGVPLFAPVLPPGYYYGAFFTTAALIALLQHNDPNGGPVNPPAVPEPAPVAVLAVGAAGIGLLTMRDRKSVV